VKRGEKRDIRQLLDPNFGLNTDQPSKWKRGGRKDKKGGGGQVVAIPLHAQVFAQLQKSEQDVSTKLANRTAAS